MEENDLWAIFWKGLWLTLCALIFAIPGCIAYESHLVAREIANGGNPVAIKCAMASVESARNSIVCYEAAKK